MYYTTKSDLILKEPYKQTKNLKKKKLTVKVLGWRKKSGKSVKIKIRKHYRFSCPFRRTRRSYHNYVANYSTRVSYPNGNPTKHLERYDMQEVSRLQDIHYGWIKRYAALEMLKEDEKTRKKEEQSYLSYRYSKQNNCDMSKLNLTDFETAIFMAYQF